MRFQNIKSHFFVITIVLATASCSSVKNVESTAKAEYNLNGPIKTIESKSYIAKDSSGTAVKYYRGDSYSFRTKDTDIGFNKNGAVISHSEFNNRDEMMAKTINRYNDKNQLIRKEEYAEGDSEPYISYEYSYREDGLVSKVKDYYYQEKRGVTDYTYDENNRLIRKEKIDYFEGKESTKSVTLIKNVDNSRKEFRSYYDEYGNLTQDDIKIYDDQDHLIETNLGLGSENAIIPRHTYSYNDKGLKISESNYMAGDELLSTDYFKYNDAGLLISESSKLNEDGEIILDNTYTYDENGNLITKREYDDEGNIDKTLVFEYQYDDQGNWIEYTLMVNGTADSIVERNITYFDE